MCNHIGFLLPKILGMAIMLVWLYFSFRKIYLVRFGIAVPGIVNEVVDNPDRTSIQNKIAHVSFDYLGTPVTIPHLFTGTSKAFPVQVTVYIDKMNVKRSVVTSKSIRSSLVVDIIVPTVFSILIVVSYVRGC